MEMKRGDENEHETKGTKGEGQDGEIFTFVFIATWYPCRIGIFTRIQRRRGEKLLLVLLLLLLLPRPCTRRNDSG